MGDRRKLERIYACWHDYSYTKGWFARIRPNNNVSDRYKALETIDNCHVKIRTIIEQLHIRCFAAFPDHEMFEIGVECAATLTKLDEQLAGLEIGQVVHLVSDDVTADLEISRWSEQTGQAIIELRR